MPSAAATSGDALLRARDVVVRFGGVAALDGVSFDCSEGEIVGLIGPNGAGKTTLLNAISGVLSPDEGSVEFGSRELANASPQVCARAGIARTFQNIRLFGGLTVRQNVEVAQTTARRYARQRTVPQVDDLISDLGLAEVADRKASTLPYGDQRRVEIARALALAPRMVLLDEPAAGMNDAESIALIDLIQRLRDDTGAGFVVIDHDLRFIIGVCDRLFVLAEGVMIAEGDPTKVQANPDVVAVYLGSTEPIPVGPNGAKGPHDRS